MMPANYRVTLTPIEPLLFSDNRSAKAGEDHLIQDQDPSPHTFFGAVGGYLAGRLGVSINGNHWTDATEYLGDFETELKIGSTDRAELLGYYYSDSKGNSWFPRPAHLRVNRRIQKVFVSENPSLTLTNEEFFGSSLTDFECFLKTQPDDFEEDLPDLIDEEILRKALCWEDLAGKELKEDIDRLPIERLFHSEVRLGQAMKFAKNRTIEGRLFSRPYRRFFSEVDPDAGEWRSAGITAHYKTRRPINEPWMEEAGIARLGGDGGRAIIRFQTVGEEKPLTGLLRSVQKAVDGSDGFFCCLLTPMVREKEWPKVYGQYPMVAAIGKPFIISGWNSDGRKQHPRPILRLVPAGSTFFYSWPEKEVWDRSEFIAKQWLEPITGETSEHYRNSGFGRTLIGVWHHES